MLHPVRRRTWAPSGETPIQKAWDRHDRISCIGAVRVTPTGRRLSFFFHLSPQNLTTEDLLWFLETMHQHLGRKVILVWDRWSVHQSVVAALKKHHPDWFQFEDLPAYSPELNPVEQCWKHCKYDDLANFIPSDLDDLHAAATDSLSSMHDDQQFLRSTFAYCQLAI
jgi:transposase